MANTLDYMSRDRKIDLLRLSDETLNRGPVVGRGGWLVRRCRGVLLIRIIVGQGSVALAVGARGGCLDILERRPDID